MALKIYWSRLAENKLEDIFDYYNIKAGVKTATKIVHGIIDRVDHLDKNPRMGQIEELLATRPQEFRFLIYTHYKIIYRVDLEKQRIIIANVFDARQSPLKIQQTKGD